MKNLLNLIKNKIVGYELFLGPESFFSPEIIDKNWKASLDESIDLTIQQCPIDYRRRLYADIVFSGGSTSFRNLDKRLELSLQKRVHQENKVVLKLKLLILWHKNTLSGLVDHLSLLMMDLDICAILEQNIKKKDLLVVDLILFLVSKKLE